MKVNVIFLDYDRHTFTEKVKLHNFKNAGYEFDHVLIDMKGISKAINTGIRQSLHYDAVVTMSNDILMPNKWLRFMVEAAKAIPETGLCGIHCVERLPDLKVINGVKVHPEWGVFGNYLIPMTAIRKVGYFNEDHDPYGMQDSDYSYRLHKTGHLNYYLADMKAEHIGADVGSGTDYRKMKDESLKKATEIYMKHINKYDESQDYTIFMNEW